jgi:hypothetical protein
MSDAPPPAESVRAPTVARDAVSVVSAYGAFRLVLVLLAIWTFFAGFSLMTGVDALSLVGSDTAERVAGAQMLVLAPLYGLLAWRRDQYRLMLWIPYAAQTGYIVAIIWSGLDDGFLLLIVSVIFLALLIYVWWSSHPPGFVEPDEEEDGRALPHEAESDEATAAERERQRRYRMRE